MRQLAGALAFENHVERGAVFDGSARIEILGLAVDLDAGKVARDLLQPEQRRVADIADEVVRHGGRDCRRSHFAGRSGSNLDNLHLTIGDSFGGLFRFNIYDQTVADQTRGDWRFHRQSACARSVTLRGGYTEVWCAEQNVPLARFADCVRSIGSVGLDRLGLTHADDVVERLRGFDDIVSWYGENRPEFRELVTRTWVAVSILAGLAGWRCATRWISMLRRRGDWEPRWPEIHGSIAPRWSGRLR